MNGKVNYYFQRPSTTNDSLITDLKGFLNLNLHSDCKIVDKKNELKYSTNKYPFRVKEHSSTTLILYASTEQERNEWIETIQEAIRGIHHINPSTSTSTAFLHRSSTSPPTILTLNNNTNNISIHSRRSLKKSNSSIQLGYQTVEYPRISGYLKKKSIEGKTLGFRNIKSRLVIIK